MSSINTERLTKILSETQAVISECNSRRVHGSAEVNAKLFENVLMELLRHRAAMLQGAEHVTTEYKLQDGWVAVPIEPTEDIIVNGFESEPDESFSDEREWEAYDAMSGCQ